VLDLIAPPRETATEELPHHVFVVDDQHVRGRQLSGTDDRIVSRDGKLMHDHLEVSLVGGTSQQVYRSVAREG